MILRINDTDYFVTTPETGWFSLCVWYKDGKAKAYVNGEETRCERAVSDKDKD